jgi:branched-chain amino acid transport system substrate-binding protein
MEKFLKYFAGLVVLAMILAACTSSPSASPSGGESAAPSTGEDPAAVCAADQFGCVEYAEGDPIVIATLLVITTADASLGLDAQYGAEVAQSMRPEVAGREVEFSFNDDLCSADGGTAGATLLASDATIAAVIGTSCSSAGVPAAQILSEKGIVLLSPSATSPVLTEPGLHQEFFLRTAHNDNIQGAAMAQFAYDEIGMRTAATIHDGGPYTEALQGVFAQSFENTGGTVTKTEVVAPDATDVSGQLTSIAADSPDFLFYPIFTVAGAQVTRQAKTTAGLEDTTLAGADGLISPDFLEAAGADAEGMYMSGPQTTFGDVYENEFLPAYTKVSGEEQPISAFHAHAFDAYNLIADAIEAVALTGSDGTLYIPRTALKDALYSVSSYAGLTGTLTCNEDGDCANTTITVRQVRDGEYVPIWNSAEGSLE